MTDHQLDLAAETTAIAENIDAVAAKVKAKLAYSLKDHPVPRLIAVSKVQPDQRIEAALSAGQRVFGENKVQEAMTRWGERREKYSDLTLVLIGSLQTNKAADAVALFDEIQSVDRLKLAKALKKEMGKQNKNVPVMIQVNTGEEPQKGGCMPADLPDLLRQCRALGLDVTGLMCIPPNDEDPSLHFHLMRKLKSENDLERLSMGMSSDYDLAAAMGSDDIRVGTAIFGARDYG